MPNFINPPAKVTTIRYGKVLPRVKKLKTLMLGILLHTAVVTVQTRAPQSGVIARLLCISWKRAKER